MDCARIDGADGCPVYIVFTSYFDSLTHTLQGTSETRPLRCVRGLCALEPRGTGRTWWEEASGASRRDHDSRLQRRTCTCGCACTCRVRYHVATTQTSAGPATRSLGRRCWRRLTQARRELEVRAGRWRWKLESQGWRWRRLVRAVTVRAACTSRRRGRGTLRRGGQEGTQRLAPRAQRCERSTRRRRRLPFKLPFEALCPKPQLGRLPCDEVH